RTFSHSSQYILAETNILAQTVERDLKLSKKTKFINHMIICQLVLDTNKSETGLEKVGAIW
ncbi:MAG: hypothetical protein IJJ85_03755, partial [Clostridia bacterium]|nr:hypothetical protein [Clostridia bacterium]